MRADRLLAMLLYVQRRGGATAAQLAEALEVSVRTVYRDVAALQAAGVPVWTETGPKGGIRLVEGWRTPVEGLTAEEAGALFLTGVPGAAAELGLGAVMATAQVKLLSTLPPELGTRASRVRERFHLDAPGWFRPVEPLAHLGLVAEAVWSQRPVEIRYGAGDASWSRSVEPLGLVLKAGIWYLVAAHGDQVRTYRLSRVSAATLLDGHFDRPERFDLAAWWAESSAAFDQSILRLEVRLRLSPAGFRAAPGVLGAAVTQPLAAAAAAGADGWRVVVLAMESEQVALSQLTGLAGEVEVLEPVSLRRALHDLGRSLADRHR
ncbi:MAG: WYL domain-containing protein [Acidimicrobiia bacterium]|nr:WYL domain-containing protein [Acidimicrobiia bacterium]